jgi:hypothetical protein
MRRLVLASSRLWSRRRLRAGPLDVAPLLLVAGLAGCFSLGTPTASQVVPAQAATTEAEAAEAPAADIAVVSSRAVGPLDAAADTAATPSSEDDDAATDEAVDPRPRLYAISGMVKIHNEPDRDSPVLGGFRAGQSVLIRTDVVRNALHERKRSYRCTEGWYPVQPRGWVCVGGEGHASKNGNDPRFLAAASVMPDLDSDYPFKYGVSTGTPQYLRIPTKQEQRATEPGLDDHLAHLPAPDDSKGGAVDSTPSGRGPTDVLLKYLAWAKPKLTDDKEAFEGMKVSWSQEFDANGRTWLLTPQLTMIPKDKVRTQPLPTLDGIDLKAKHLQLPLAYLWLDDSYKYRQGDDGKL